MDSAAEVGRRRVVRGGRSRFPIADVTLAFASAFAAVIIALVAAYAFVPEVRPWLAASDGLVAWTVTATLGFAVAVAIWAFGRSTPDSRFRMLIPAVAALLLLQSLRFGSNILGFSLPNVSGIEVGSLLDLRRVVSVFADGLELGPGVGALVLLLLAIATGWAGSSAWNWARDRTRITETLVVTYFVAAMGVEAMVPVLGFFGRGDGAWFATAMTGLVGAGLLVVAGLASGDHRTTATGWRRRIWPWIADEGPLSGIPADVR